MREPRPGGRLAVYATTAKSLRRIGIGRSGTHRLLTVADLRNMIGPTTEVTAVKAGFGVAGMIGTFDKPPPKGTFAR